MEGDSVSLNSFAIFGFYTTPNKFENATLFTRLRLPSTLFPENYPHETELFENTL